MQIFFVSFGSNKHITKINLIHVLSCVDFIFICLDCARVLNTVKCLSVVAEWSKAAGCKVRDHWFDPRWRPTFSFEFIAFYPFLTVRRSPYKWNQAWQMKSIVTFIQSYRCIEIDIILKKDGDSKYDYISALKLDLYDKSNLQINLVSNQYTLSESPRFSHSDCGPSPV